jgi:hypothetical protein
MAGMRALRMPPRRPTTIALLVLAGLCLALVGAALWNPWRLTAFYPVETTGVAFAILTLAGALIAITVLISLADRGRWALVGLVVALAAVPALCVGLPALALGDSLRDDRIKAERVLATSPEGGYSVVALTYSDDATELVIRSRRGLLSRESPAPIARCARDPFVADLPPESVRFTDETRVTVPVPADGVSVTVTFDAGSLAPAETIEMCEI